MKVRHRRVYKTAGVESGILENRMARVIFGFTVLVLLSVGFSRVIPTKHDLIVVENPEDGEKTETVTNDGDDFYDPSLGPFIPTKEWQVVKRGQRIPAGLHVRLNFKTKIREAKLMEDDDGSRFQHQSQEGREEKDACLANENCKMNKNPSSDDSSDAGPKIRINPEAKLLGEYEHNGSKLYFTKSQLKEAIQEFKDKLGPRSSSEVENIAKDNEIPKVRKDFKSMEEIRGDLKQACRFHTKSEAEIIHAYLDVLQRKNSSEQQKEVAMEDLEYLSHQLSNAIDLAKMGGLKVVVHYLNQSSNEVLQEKAAKVIAAAVQSNPTAQDAALDSGVVPVLLRIMSSTKVFKLKKRTLYALAALLRGHIQSQKLFIKLHGLSLVLDLIKTQENGNIRLQGLTLITDLSVEQKEILAKLKEQKKVSEKQSLSIMPALAKHGWCEVLPQFLDTQDVDTLEKVLQAIKESKKHCASKFKETKLSTTFQKVVKLLKNRYDDESDKDFKEYLGNLRNIAVGIIS